MKKPWTGKVESLSKAPKRGRTFIKRAPYKNGKFLGAITKIINRRTKSELDGKLPRGLRYIRRFVCERGVIPAPLAFSDAEGNLQSRFGSPFANRFQRVGDEEWQTRKLLRRNASEIPDANVTVVRTNTRTLSLAPTEIED